MNDTPDKLNQIEMAAEIVSAYVSNNSLPASELPSLIETVHASLGSIMTAAPVVVALEAKPPAISIKKSVTDEYIVCLECGKRFKSLKRHLHAEHGISTEDYRSKWGLRPDYPMVAPAYADARSALAKKMGLGQQRKMTGGMSAAGDVEPEIAIEPEPEPEVVAAPAPPPAPVKKTRGRAKAVPSAAE